MKAVYSLASQVMSGVFVACLALALVGYVYADPGGGGGGDPACVACMKAQYFDWTLNSTACSDCDYIPWIFGADCYDTVNPGDPSLCNGNVGGCDTGCTCMRVDVAVYVCQ